jgi:UDP-N-acetyl-2-amino-2-deoxyglucuronate dehydrogenase
MEDKLRVGIVGCGYQGGRLAQAIALVDTLTITACADIIPERAVELAAFAGQASAHTSAEDLLQENNVDVVMVATPHHVLAPISLLAIRAGKHVLSEKPCGMSAAEMAEVEQAVASAGVSYLAGYSFRYIPAWYKVHELLEQGVVGEILAVMGCIGTGAMNEGWKSTPETGGGPLMYVGSHLVDQVLWYMQDDPVEVYASTRFRSDTRADETSAFQVTFSRGATAQLMSSQTANGFLNQVDIFGRDGSISMRPCGFLDYEVTASSRVIEEYKEPAVIHVPVAGDVRNVKHSRQLAEFVQAIRSGQPVFTTVHQARQVMEVVDAVFTSSRTGEPVRMAQEIPVRNI